MGKLNRDAKRYLREIRSWLPCAGRMKGKMLEEIRGRLNEFLLENSGADYSAIVERFGTPQQIAASYVNEAETGELLKKMRIRRKIVTVTFATAAILILICTALVTVELVSDAYKAKNFYYEVEVIEDQWLAENGGNA